MHEAILEELGLMPLWQLRPTTPVVGDVKITAGEEVNSPLTIITMKSEGGASGWVLMSEAMAEDAAVLFANMARAMHLRQYSTMQLTYPELQDAAINNSVQWIWVLGGQVAQCMLGNEFSMAKSPQQALRWQNLPVFVSLPLCELLLRPQEKSGLWIGWCKWQAKI